MNKTELHQLVISVREQIQDDLITLLEEQFETNDQELLAFSDLVCGVVVTNFHSIIESI